MTEESKRNEFWKYLTTEKNQPRPKGITTQRLAVVKTDILKLPDFWFDVIARHGAEARSAQEFYQSGEARAQYSRTDFWALVSRTINRQKEERNKIFGREKGSNRRQG